MHNFAVDEPLERQELSWTRFEPPACGKKKTQYGRIVILLFSARQS
jgi:hypothetical protein